MSSKPLFKIDHEPSKWDLRFLELSRLVASWSKDPSTKCGTVIVRPDKSIVSVGYNGLPQGIEDSDARLGNREIKYAIIRHSESNAIRFAGSNSIEGCSVYNWPMMSCAKCASDLIAYRVAEVVAPVNDNPRWQDSFNLSYEILREAGIPVRLIAV